MVAEVGAKPDDDQIYRISWDGSVSDEPGFVAFGGQADQVAAALKERFSDDMSLTEALGAALDALAAAARPAAGSAGSGSAAGNGAPATELTAAHLEVAILDRARAHRTFRRLHGPRLEELLAESPAPPPRRRRGPRLRLRRPRGPRPRKPRPRPRRAPHRPVLGRRRRHPEAPRQVATGQPRTRSPHPRPLHRPELAVHGPCDDITSF